MRSTTTGLLPGFQRGLSLSAAAGDYFVRQLLFFKRSHFIPKIQRRHREVVVWRLQPLLCLKILSYSNRSWIVVVITAFVAAWVGRFVHTIVGVGLSVYPHENSTTNQASATKPGTQVDLGPVVRVLLFWGWKVKGQVHTIKSVIISFGCNVWR